MATCGSLRQFFENPLPEKPTLLESLSSWNQILPAKPAGTASFTEIFGELHFQEKPVQPLLPPAAESDAAGKKSALDPPPGSPKNSESLQLCTEGLGFESLGDAEDLMKDSGEVWAEDDKGKRSTAKPAAAKSRQGFPPPISSIGRSGKPWVFFRSYRNDGRFVLREIRIPSQEFLHASREDGRLKLQFVHPNEQIEEDGEEEEEEEEHEQEQQD